MRVEHASFCSVLRSPALRFGKPRSLNVHFGFFTFLFSLASFSSVADFQDWGWQQQRSGGRGRGGGYGGGGGAGPAARSRYDEYFTGGGGGGGGGQRSYDPWQQQQQPQQQEDDGAWGFYTSAIGSLTGSNISTSNSKLLAVLDSAV